MRTIERALLAEVIEWNSLIRHGKLTGDNRMKRILALDGGGIRGAFSLEILARMEELLRRRTGSPNSCWPIISTPHGGHEHGAIIATCLSWGMAVADIRRLYTETCNARAPGLKRSRLRVIDARDELGRVAQRAAVRVRGGKDRLVDHDTSAWVSRRR